MELGTVKWFSRVRGFGFIVADVGGADVFAHWTKILTGEPGQRNLVTDQRVSFVRKRSREDKNRFVAHDIEIIEDNAPVKAGA